MGDCDKLEDFESECKKRKLSEHYVTGLFARLSDRETFLEALDSISKLPINQIEKFAENIFYLSMLPKNTSDQKASLIGVDSVSISVKDLGKKADAMASYAKDLRQLIREFEVPASDVAVTVSEFAALLQTIEQLRGTLRTLETVEKIGKSWSARLARLNKDKRTVLSQPSAVEQFARRLTRIWLRSGGEVVSNSASEFAIFLECCFKSVGRGSESSSYRLEAALRERSFTDGENDIFTVIDRSRINRHRRAVPLR